MTEFTAQLKKLASRRSLRTHTPAHGGSNLYLNSDFNKLFKYDLSEITGLDDLHNPESYLLKAQKQCAELFQVEDSYFSVNGASACLMAACIALGEGGKVLLPRNSHKSIVAGCILAGLDPVWYEPNWNSEWGIYDSLNLQIIADLIYREGKTIKACFVTSPTYEGVAPKLGELVELCHENRIPVIADESHGAHLSLLGAGAGAINDCCDVIIHSAHKSLGALTQTGIIHIQSEFIDPQRISSALSLLQTTSPSFILLASLVSSINKLSQNLSPLRQQQWLANNLREKLGKSKGISLLQNTDPAKLVVRIEGWSGFKLSDWLLKNHEIETELQNEKWIMCSIPIGAKWHAVFKLQRALEKASKSQDQDRPTDKLIAKPERFVQKSSPRAAYFRNPGNKMVFKCPPGIPTYIPGAEVEEIITLHKITEEINKPKKKDPYLDEEFDEEEFDEEFSNLNSI